MIDFLTLLSFASLAGWAYLTLFHSRFWWPLAPQLSPEPAVWPDIDIIVPARNEADMVTQCFPSLLAQDYPGTWRIILVDDRSSDGTADTARAIANRKNMADRLTVVTAPEKPAGWSGKVAAMQAGVAQSKASYILFTDADIWHPTDTLRVLAARAIEQKLDLVSRMAQLHSVSAAENLLIPAFVFFFTMLYPFHRANDPDSSVAAAAGGTMLLRRAALNEAGGLAAIKSALIDDCALARLIKMSGDQHVRRTELTLSYRIRSLRPYPHIGDIWRMIARSAFVQLRYSTGLLIGTVGGMAILFVIPILATAIGGTFTTKLGLIIWIIISLLYAPMIQFYRLPLIWALTLPVAALVYIGATIDSARLYWQGKGGQWKGRTDTRP